jgi:hypothetical protein
MGNINKIWLSTLYHHTNMSPSSRDFSYPKQVIVNIYISLLNMLYLLSSWLGNAINIEQMYGHVTHCYR